MTISFTLNGAPVSVAASPLARLLDVLRVEFGLTGVKEGCGEGECGACAVLVNGRVVNACITPAGAVQDALVVTVEGYRLTERYAVVERALVETGAVQCGFCTPGIVMAAEAILSGNPAPTDEEIRHGLSGNLCRCTGYTTIVAAVAAAAARLREG